MKIEKKKKIKSILPFVLVILSFLVLINVAFSSLNQYEEIEREIKAQTVLYENEVKYQKTLKDVDSLSEEELNNIIVEKAHSCGYIFPNEVVFYDTQ